jgi:glycosyltransferase involved in cell wall biosynthesis
MRVIHVVPAVSDEASGPSHSVLRLCESLIGTGADARVVTVDADSARSARPYLVRFPMGLGPRRLGVSPQMHRWLNANAGRVDLIHNHSLWMMPNVYPGRVCRRNERCRLVVSPRGTLSRWALSLHAIRKRVFWHLLQAPAVRGAVCFHATAESEYEDIRSLGFRQPVCILPNGVDVPAIQTSPSADRRQLLFLGRIHPTKGVDILLRAWRAVEHRFPQWELHVAGPDSGGHLAKVQLLAAQLNLHRVTFRGPLYGEAKRRAYEAASLFVLPTHSENFGMAVAEALASGTPAVVTVGAPWSGLNDEGAGWWIDIGVDPLVACLEEALASPPELLGQMGAAGRHWMTRDFAWRRIGEQCAATYGWLLQGGEAPPWVRLN